MIPKTRVTVLGCGTSTGVPRFGSNWGACDPGNPRNRRLRAAVLIERGDASGMTRVLVDMGPDIRHQILNVEIDWVDGVLVTHPHADHIHGIDDLRGFFQAWHRRVDVYMDQPTADRVLEAFAYCFVSPEGSSYPPILSARALRTGEAVTITGRGGPITAMPFNQQHGTIASLGFRIGDFTYSTDVNGFDAAAEQALLGTRIWILDALRHEPHPSHFCVDEALAWVERIRPDRTIFTHLDHTMDYETVNAALPSGVELAYDGMSFGID